MNDQDYHTIQRVLNGEQRAYRELVERHKEKAMTLAVRMLRNPQDAEEALQDAFVRAFNALRSFEWKSSFSTWFYRIVYNVCATALSKRGEALHQSLTGNEDESFEFPSSDNTPDVHVESNEFRQIVMEEIESLPPSYSPLVTLFFIQEMSYDEIVQTTGLPLGTVKNRLFRARVILRNTVLSRVSERDPNALHRGLVTKERAL